MPKCGAVGLLKQIRFERSVPAADNASRCLPLFRRSCSSEKQQLHREGPKVRIRVAPAASHTRARRACVSCSNFWFGTLVVGMVVNRLPPLSYEECQLNYRLVRRELWRRRMGYETFGNSKRRVVSCKSTKVIGVEDRRRRALEV